MLEEHNIEDHIEHKVNMLLHKPRNAAHNAEIEHTAKSFHADIAWFEINPHCLLGKQNWNSKP